MRTTIKVLGLISIFFFFTVLLTDWRFNNTWLPTTLITVGIFSILFEFWIRIKNEDRRFDFGIAFIIIQVFSFLGSIYFGMVLNYNFLSFRTKVFSNNGIQIDSYDGFLGKHIGDNRKYYLLHLSCWNTVIKEVENTEINEKDKECIVEFKAHEIKFDICNGNKYQ